MLEYYPAMRRLHRVVAVVTSPQPPFELACAAEVFGTARPDLPVHYAFQTCAERPGRIPTQTAFDIVVDSDLSALRGADTIVVPSWPRTVERPSAAVINALRRAHARGARVVGLCSGAFVLAHAGLLDGRRATTHWRWASQLADTFPGIEVDFDVLYVDDCDVATSAGTAAGIDLCLHLVRRDVGAAYAQQIARGMVTPPHRDGGQRQYLPPAVAASGDSHRSLGYVLDWALGRLGEPITVADLADLGGMSPRTLARRFRDQVGTSPGQWLLAQRIAAAQALLEQTDLPVESIASRVGLRSATNLRRRFRNALHTTPGAYRRTFSAG